MTRSGQFSKDIGQHQALELKILGIIIGSMNVATLRFEKTKGSTANGVATLGLAAPITIIGPN
jgi:hypothetical protein